MTMNYLLRDIAKQVIEKVGYNQDKAFIAATHAYRIDTGNLPSMKEIQFLYEIITERCDAENDLKKRYKIKLYKQLKKEIL